MTNTESRTALSAHEEKMFSYSAMRCIGCGGLEHFGHTLECREYKEFGPPARYIRVLGNNVADTLYRENESLKLENAKLRAAAER